jgi:hypothetical protein
VIEMTLEWVTGPEQGKASGRFAAFSLWTGVIRDAISSVPDETVNTAVTRSSLPRWWQQVYHEEARMTVG